jgi:1-deoxy-D-xylulose-5-phosphate synthase
VEKTFSSVFGNKLTKIADNNDKVCAITAAMMQGTGLTPFKKNHPEHFYDVGIAESHAVTFAAGLSANGYLPVVAVYSSFLQRAYDNIIHDVALQNLPVLFCIDRAGLNARDGATHHGIFDVSFLLQIPGMDIWEPLSFDSFEKMMDGYFSSEKKRPTAIRYPSGGECDAIALYLKNNTTSIIDGVYADFTSKNAPDNIIVTYGRLCAEAIEAKKESDRVGLILLEHLSDLDILTEAILPYVNGKNLIFAEEGMYNGSLAVNLSQGLKEKGFDGKISVLAIKDSFVVQTTEENIYKTAGIDKDSIMQHFV